MFQYNLKSLLYVMLGACLLTWLFFVLPGGIGVTVLMCLFMVLPSAVIAGILYFRGYPQAFAIGCVPPMIIISLLALGEGFPWRFGPGDATEMKIILLISLLVVMAGGAASAGIRRLAVWSQQPMLETKSFPGLSREVTKPAASPFGSAEPRPPVS